MVLRRIPHDGSDSRKELNMNLKNTRTLTGMAIMTAIVIVLQLLGSFIRFGPFSISLVLIPIVVGAALYGEIAGAWLGFIFGLVVLLSGDAGAFLAVNPLGTVLTVLVKGACAGFVAGLIFLAEGQAEFTTNYIKPFGTIYINLLKFLVVPVVITSIVSGVVSLGDVRRVGEPARVHELAAHPHEGVGAVDRDLQDALHVARVGDQEARDVPPHCDG